jgi:hypothetical protein
MVDKAIDEIRDMMGAIQKNDTYSNPKIKLIKKVEKKLYIFNYECKDLTKSKVQENIKVLYEGKAKLVELKTPDTDKLEYFLNAEFKYKKYKTATERKKEIRKEMYIYIFGPHPVLDNKEYIKKTIDELYEIKIKSVLTKGKKRLRNLAIKEIEEKDPTFFENKRITRRGHIIYVNPLVSLYRGARTYEKKRNAISEINNENYDEDFLKEAKKIITKFENRLIIIDYPYYKKRKEITSHMATTMKEEIEHEIEEIKKWEEVQISKLMMGKEKNMEKLEEMILELKKLKRTYDPSKSFKITSNEISSKKDLKIDSKEEIINIIHIKKEWDGERDKIAFTYPETFKYKKYTATTIDLRDKIKVFKKIAKTELRFNLYYERRWKKAASIYLFINKKEEGEKRIYEIWLANGIWVAMSEEDFENMKPYFDEDMKLIKEI